jgi:hypothetical protein
VLAAISSGCFAPAGPRLADVDKTGGFSLMLSLPVAGYAPGTTRGRSAGNTIGAGPTIMLIGVLGLEIEGTVGVGHHCELGAIVGVNRLGAETRCAVLDERDGAAASVAPFVRGGYQPGPAFLPSGPWFAAGVDLSAGRHPGLAFSPTVSYGVESHSIALPPGPGLEQENFMAIGRREWRLNLPVGLGFTPTTGTSTGRFTLGVTPYWTFDHGAPSCGNCKSDNDRASATSFTEDWGILLQLSGGPIWLP